LPIHIVDSNENGDTFAFEFAMGGDIMSNKSRATYIEEQHTRLKF